MSDNSRIEWTDATWNPTTGCTKVSPGCDHCYAEGIFNRFNGPGAFDTVQLRPERLDQPFRWRKPRLVFVNSMSDLLHEAVPDDYIARVFAVMALAPRHTFQVLTKRHARMRSLLNDEDFRSMVSGEIVGMAVMDGMDDSHLSAEALDYADWWPLRNVWLGVSVEDQKWADIRMPALRETPAAVRFLSCEPLLGRVSLTATANAWGAYPIDDINWVIVGGESGPDARPMDAEWARQLRDECEAHGVAFFMKQAGAVLARSWGCTDRKGHNPDEWPDEFPRQMPARAPAVSA